MCFPSAVRPSLKVALEPTPVCRWATHGTPTVTRHLPLELHELKQDHIHGLIHREFECDCVGTCRRFGSGMPRCSDLLSPTNFHLPRLVAFCQHFFINAVHRNWELDQEAQRDLSLHWSHAEMSWSEAPFISLTAGCRSIETLRSYQPHRRAVYLLV